ncbi:MAG: hypothetical protein LBS76_00715 [Mycoplasmataceae bacterium]|jgi:Holliday junction DNA helicase RuvA|nr:hypothetical protein [Mycoplasmataceae bacterium]
MIGKVISINKKTITFENNYTGYFINVCNPERYEVNKIKKLYLYKHMATNNKNNFIEEFYGFDRYELKELFLHLISISGIGPRTALNVCCNDPSTIKQLIHERDVQGLSVLDGITPKYARLIIDNLCDTFTIENAEHRGLDIGKLVQALKSLGYSAKDIDWALKHLDQSQSNVELSDLISQAIKVIAIGQNDASIIKAN